MAVYRGREGVNPFAVPRGGSAIDSEAPPAASSAVSPALSVGGRGGRESGRLALLMNLSGRGQGGQLLAPLVTYEPRYTRVARAIPKLRFSHSSLCIPSLEIFEP